MQLLEAGSSHTDWSLILDAGQADEQAAASALERLMRRYWPAVYAYIRGTGRDVHEAADLTQGFVCDVIIARRLCAAADPQRGRFRSLLLSAVKIYLREQHRHESRLRRSGQQAKPLRIIEPDRVAAESGPHPTPEAAFSYQWSATLVRRVLESVRARCLADGLGAHWNVFEHRVVRPMLLGEPPADHAQLVERLGLKDVSQAANMMVTVKRRFVGALYAEVGQTVSDPADIEDELHQLLRDLERPS
ncbi:MAG: RNA polymerase sigma factor [Planctomycetota bacterium]